jgi:hypothetical protein
MQLDLREVGCDDYRGWNWLRILSNIDRILLLTGPANTDLVS